MALRFTLVIAAVCLFVFQSPALGHHSFAAEFTAEERATITGVVTEVWFRNPHIRYFVEVKGDAGEVQRWDTRGSSPSLLVRKGWTKKTISVGDVITIEGHLGRFDKNLLSIITVELADGRKIGQGY